MFEKLFSREEAVRKKGKGSPKFAPNTKISYNPALIPTLQKEHLELLDVFVKASKAAHAGIPKRSKKLFSEFKGVFINHVLRENTSLYIYLQHSAPSTTSQESFSTVKAEMEKISREVMQFLNYAIEESTSIDHDFLQKMDEISDILHHRIKQEESHIYPNYLTLKLTNSSPQVNKANK